jgi:hypothetical protein
MIKVTRWTPDTCDGCVLEYSWDTDASEDQRVHTPHTVVSKCDVHKLDNDAQVHAKVKGENMNKNQVIGEITENFPAFAKLDINGNKIHDDNKVKWSFDANRKLVVELKGAKANEKAAVQSHLNTKFANKVDLI